MSESLSVLTTTSGPIPAGSPMVMARVGLIAGSSSACLRGILGLQGTAIGSRSGAFEFGFGQRIFPCLLAQLIRLVHVLDLVLHDKKVGCIVAVDLDAGLVVPLDDAARLPSVQQ